MTEGKGRTVCFGTNYRQAPEVLHGYNESLKGKKHLSGAALSTMQNAHNRVILTE